jgi:hypothetical protein
MQKIIVIVIHFLFLSTLLYAQPSIISSQPNNTTINKFDKFELTIGLNATYTNPYDYDEIVVQAIFNKPSGKKDTVDGFFMQDYSLNNGNITSVGTGAFKIRYTPNEVGMYSYSVSCLTAAGVGQYPTQFFTCNTSTQSGFIRKNNTNYLSFDDGKQFFPIGENMGWQNNQVVNDYTTWLSSLTSNGGNFIRVWMSSWAFALEWKNNTNGYAGLKKYKQSNAFYFDWLLDYCKQNNVYVMATLNNHGQVSSNVNPEWNDNPYKSTNGGPAVNTWDFFTNTQAKNLHKNRLRYLIARYGYATSLQSWELFNEVDWTDDFANKKIDVKNWHQEMCSYIKSKDVYNHLVSTSFAKDVFDDATWNIPQIDFTQTHYYIDAPNLETSIAAGSQTYLNNYQKPVLNGEFGLGPEGATLSTNDPNGIHIHNSLWAIAYSGALGTGLTWWWDTYIHPRNLYPYFKPLATIINSIDFVKDNYKVTNATTNGGGTADASIVPGGDWGLAAAANFTIDASGVIAPSAAQLSKFMYGNSYNTQFRKPPTFTVTYSIAGQFKVITGGSIGTSPKINITVDGIEVLNTNAAVNSTYSVNITAGTHTIKVDNLGTDWFLVSNYIFTNIGKPVTTYALKSSNNAKAIGYILNNNYNYKFLQNSNGVAPNAINGAVLQLTGLQNGPCKIDYYSCSTSLLLNTVIGFVTNGQLNAPLPSFTWDINFKVNTNYYRFTGTGNWTVASNWLNNNIPPAILPPGGEIIIDPINIGECVVNTPQTISAGGKIVINQNKKIVVNGNLQIQ